MNLVSTLEAMVEAGASAEMVLAVVRRHESERERARQERRDADAQRQREHRARSTQSQPVTVTERDSHGPSPHVGERSAQVVVSSLPSLRSEEVGGGGGECGREPVSDWPDGKPTDHLKRLIEAVGSPWLDPSKSPGLVTTSGRLAAWKRDGASWEHDVVPVVTALCGKQRGQISTWKFFDPAIGRSVADNRAALEIPDGTVVRLHATGPPSSFATQFAAERAEARKRALEDG